MALTERGGLRSTRPAADSPAALRKFGLVMAAAFGVLGAIAWWRGRAIAPYLGGLAALFLVAGLAAPRALAPVERAWRQFAELLGAVTTRVLVTLTFLLVMVPIGLLRRLFGVDSLGLRFDRAKSSYWVKVEPDGPCSRPDKPY